ncbi:MAG TPA: VWA domain-containing protein [Steroidobacteraceae bacterium]|nr:VWA domain-containing protein [Steroidobacteraceae bacterium]
MTRLHFLHPAWLALLPGLWLLALWLSRRRAREGGWSQLVDAQLLSLLRLGEDRPARGVSPWSLIALAWTLSALALAAPSWQRQPTAVYRAPVSWVLVLDLSASMMATDVAPNRVTRARYAMQDLLSAAQDARVGLVVFSGEPYTVTPLTTDVATVRLLLGPLSPALMPESGDQLAPALSQAAQLLRSGQGSHGQVIVFTDGFADPAQALIVAAQLHRQGVAVNLVGIGSAAGAPDPDGKGGFVRDSAGHVVLSRLDADLLRRVARAGGGRYVSLEQLPSLIASLQAASARALPANATALQPQLRVARWRNGGVWLLPPLLLLAALLARRGWI